MSTERVQRLGRRHDEAYRGRASLVLPLPGARALLDWLTRTSIAWAISTSGRMETASVGIRALGVDPAEPHVVTRDQVRYGEIPISSSPLRSA